jgi:hypothetical protein
MRERRNTVTSVVQSGTIVGGQGPVRLRVVRAGPQENTVELSVNYEKAEVPPRAYFADYCDVVQGRGSVSIFFGKLKPGTSVLRNKVEIGFPEDLFIRQVWKNSRKLHEKVEAEFGPHPLPPIGEVTDTDVVQAFRANNVLMLGMGEEALADFYYIAPTEIHFALNKGRQEVALDPVIRIVLSGLLMLELLEKCRPVVEALPNFRLIMEEGEAP